MLLLSSVEGSWYQQANSCDDMEYVDVVETCPQTERPGGLDATVESRPPAVTLDVPSSMAPGQ